VAPLIVAFSSPPLAVGAVLNLTATSVEAAAAIVGTPYLALVTLST
jgi:hypothetical protein